MTGGRGRAFLTRSNPCARADTSFPGLLTVGLLITSIGWFRAADVGSDRAFNSCSFDGQTLVLSYTYGANEVVNPSIDTTGPDVVVALRIRQGGGSAPAIGLIGETRFGVYGGQKTVRYPGGEALDCPAS